MIPIYKIGNKYFVRERKSPIMLGTNEEGQPVVINITTGETFEANIIKLQAVEPSEED